MNRFNHSMFDFLMAIISQNGRYFWQRALNLVHTSSRTRTVGLSVPVSFW